ncbi:aminotransferase class V-fold PLP-dependent enzyme [Motiliproteus sediminis]|uniref:aminotransferase class V-fold PLP-dependent enzyme n=1 Tax=Motiliproteus sediminis TaxID=1468178 RepID=UPI001AEF978D|nr:aminotransferase class V-fold PLP-dependent enzyme [Motiliproteus sediminis]
MPGLLSHVDPDGLLEYSVVYTDRALNHMSERFQQVMREISTTLKQVYHADAVAVVPGSGTFGMEAVARQFAGEQPCLVIRNGWFSYRWSQILEMGAIAASVQVMKARPATEHRHSSFVPAPIEEVCEQIADLRPQVVFAPHVETSSGMLLPDDYLRRLADAVHGVGGLLVLDCIASGALWVDMQALDIDVLVSAPQKGWSGSPCCGLVMLRERALARMAKTTSSSFACDLKKWHQIMLAYEQGGHAYHATMPTDGLRVFAEVMRETADYGFDKVREEQLELGRRVRQLLDERGFDSVAAPGFEAPGVVVCYTQDGDLHSGGKFRQQGLQIAAGVPLACDEPEWFKTFRIGLFGLDKLHHPERTVAELARALDSMA